MPIPAGAEGLDGPLVVQSATPAIPTSITRPVYCKLSGVLLATMDVHIFEGHLAYLEAHTESVYLHPFYKLSSSVLIKKLEDSLHHAQESGWNESRKEQERLCILTSAMMYSFGCLKQDRPTLPAYTIASASAGRLLGLAKWFFFLSSQRMEFPVYSISGRNENTHWENFRHWLDSAYAVREDWAHKSRQLAQEAQKKAYEESLKEVVSENIYKKLDIKKIWNWAHIQLADHYSPGRLQTFKTVFLNGDLEAHYWVLDDIEDLKMALVQHCDIGNEIMHFINKRLDGIRAIIKDFQSSFTLLAAKPEGFFGNDEQTPQEALFLAGFDKQVEALETLPDAPKRENFASIGLYLKAQAQWNILERRFKQKGAGQLMEKQVEPEAGNEDGNGNGNGS